ncbi:hypothetical protein AZF39_00139 [Lactiplantibacillus plantarum]|nr:hypothetical protein AZF39_00139 [Lactiplantibacillus plantarum]
MANGKTTDGLMRHIRDSHNIEIRGSSEKKKLTAMGYFHGYKAYRFNKDIQHMFTLDNFKQIIAINTFDEQMKACFYPLTMKFEALLKNYLIEQTVAYQECSYEYIYNQKLIEYRSYAPNTPQFKNAVKKRLSLKKSLDSAVAYDYQNDNSLIKHYIENNKPIPLWAIFETISLGLVGSFAASLNKQDRINIAQKLHVYDPNNDVAAKILQQSIYTIKDLRNSIAHNKVIFDCRFSSQHQVSNNVKRLIRRKLRIPEQTQIDFSTLFYYFALLIIFIKESGASKTELKRYIASFSSTTNNLKNCISDTNINFPQVVYNQIVGTGITGKIDLLKSYI